jgi:hypothetical protein
MAPAFFPSAIQVQTPKEFVVLPVAKHFVANLPTRFGRPNSIRSIEKRRLLWRNQSSHSSGGTSAILLSS